MNHSTDVIWKPIEGYEGFYEVSEFGEIRRLQGWQCLRTRIIKPSYSPNGYVRTSLSNGNGRDRRYVHRLVYAAFVTPIPQGYEVHHKDGNRENNHYSNLEALSPRENFEVMMVSNSRQKFFPYNQLSGLDKEYIRRAAKYRTRQDLARMFKVGRHVIRVVQEGK